MAACGTDTAAEGQHATEFDSCTTMDASSAVSRTPDGTGTPNCLEGCQRQTSAAPECSEPGAGPASAKPDWLVGKFPLKPILDLYQETQCRTLSPAFIWRLVHELPQYVAELAAGKLGAATGDVTGAIVELSGFSTDLVRAAVGCEQCSDEELETKLRFMLALWVLRDTSAAAAQAWTDFLAAMPYGYFVEGQIPNLLLVMTASWGTEATAGAIGVSAALLEGALGVGADALYQEVLGVSQKEAFALLDQAGITAEDELLAFLSVVHVTAPLDGYRSAYVFVVDNNLTPVQGLTAENFKVEEDGVPVPAGAVEVRTLESFSDVEGADAQFSIAFVLDYSGSMSANDKGYLEEALLYLVETLPPVYRASITKFNNEVASYQTMTGNKTLLQQAISAPMTSGSTALYDAMAAGLVELEAESTPFRVEIAFTDGMENSSRTNCHASVVEVSRDMLVPVFVIGMGQIEVPPMFTMTNETNGCFLYAPSSDELKDLYELIGTFFADTYVLRWPAKGQEKSAPVFVSVAVPEGLAETTGGEMYDTWTPPEPSVP